MTKLKLLAAGGALVLGACSSASSHDMGSMASPPPTTSAAPSSTSAATPASGPHNDADVTFASMMRPHHNEAIEMSNLLLAKNGIDPKVTALARKVKAEQGPEVTQMTGWLTGWGTNPSPSSMGDMDGTDHSDGTMTPADMDALKLATGAKATRLFLDGMIKHHNAAVAMAGTEVESGQNPDAEKLAQTIISAQKAEIVEMNRLGGS